MAQDTAGLIKALLNSGKISADTREDLEEFQNELKEGALDQSDTRYVQALAARILGKGEISDVDDVEDDDEEEIDESEWDELEERAEEAEARVEELEAEVAALEERIDALEGELATLKGVNNPEQPL